MTIDSSAAAKLINQYFRDSAWHPACRIRHQLKLDAADPRHGIDWLSPDSVRDECDTPSDVNRDVRAAPANMARCRQ